MEKRALLAFVLSVAVFMLWSFLFGPKKKNPGQTITSTPKASTKVTQKTEKTAKIVTTKEGISKPEVTSPKPSIKQAKIEDVEGAKDIIVDTPLYKATFTTFGARLKSFKLKKYRETVEKNSPLKELIYVKDPSSLPFRLHLITSKKRYVDDYVYEADKETIVLADGNTNEGLKFRVKTKDGLSFTKTFIFHGNSYLIDIEINIDAPETVKENSSIQLDLVQDVTNWQKSSYVFRGFAAYMDGKLTQLKPDKKKAKEVISMGVLDWTALEEAYFMTALILPVAQKVSLLQHIYDNAIAQTSILMPLKKEEVGPKRLIAYIGPKKLSILKAAGHHLDKAINYGWFDIIAKPLLYMLNFFYRFVHNYGVAIIILTIVVKIIFWPLTHKSYESMKQMQKLQPHIARIREKYKNDKQKMQQEIMALYKTYKINPMGGCLPMIIQIPVFFALYRLLYAAIELRHAPFFLWINDLSAPDRLFRFNFSIPFMHPPYGIPVLTLLMGLTMYLQQKMSPQMGDPTQAKFMMFLPIMFTVIFINFPSGLVLYWLVNNILSIGQQMRINKGTSQ